MTRQTLERDTGELFSGLWSPYDENLFEQSVELFTDRLRIIGFDLNWFKGKTVLDAGCGGGRNAIAMARLGAKLSCGIDIGEGGIEDAKRRAANLNNTAFKVSSILDIPHESNAFDLVWCAGVLMITDDEDRALDELTRVVKPGGMLYLLVYATGGMRWPLIELLRPLAEQISLPTMEKAIADSNTAPNKRRTFLDDLYCPKLDFYHWDRLRRMLEKRGYTNVNRLGTEVRLDHEHSLKDYRIDLDALRAIFQAGENGNIDGQSALFRAGRQMIGAAIDAVAWFENQVARGNIGEKDAMTRVIGQGHHRVFATKS